jgi:tol-pal system protein YbgF
VFGAGPGSGAAAAALGCALALSACATAGGGQIESDLDAIQQQLWKVQKENAALTEQIGQLRNVLEAAAAAGPGSAELRLRVEAVERDLQALRLRADDSERRLAAAVQDLRAARDAIEVLAAPARSEPAGGAPAAPPDATAAPTPAGPGPVAEAPRAGRPEPPPAFAGSVAAVGAEDLYRQAYADYSKGNYALALQELREFLGRAPSSHLADDAQYLVGEVHYSQGHHAEAVAAFDQMITSYPKGDKVPSAHLKKGLALLELNRTADAVIQFQHVVTVYPRSEEARMARQRLRALGL